MAQPDYFLKVDGVQGESVDSQHRGEIDVLSVSVGLSQEASGVGGGGGAGKVAVQELHLLTRAGIHSPRLLVATATGEVLKRAVLTVRRAGGKQPLDVLKVTIENVRVTSYQISGAAAEGDGLPLDQLLLKFSKIEVSVSRQRADGSLDAPVVGGYDVVGNKKV